MSDNLCFYCNLNQLTNGNLTFTLSQALFKKDVQISKFLLIIHFVFHLLR